MLRPDAKKREERKSDVATSRSYLPSSSLEFSSTNISPGRVRRNTTAQFRVYLIDICVTGVRLFPLKVIATRNDYFPFTWLHFHGAGNARGEMRMQLSTEYAFVTRYRAACSRSLVQCTYTRAGAATLLPGILRPHRSVWSFPRYRISSNSTHCRSLIGRPE